MNAIQIIAAVLILLFALGWLGLKLKPAPFPVFNGQRPALKSMPLPVGLPAPVERFYRIRYGEEILVITSAILTGHGRMAPFGVSFPMRFRFLYEVGKDYRARLEATFFRRTVMAGDETYIDGRAYGKLTTGTNEGAWFDEAMNVRVWTEILTWFPAALLSDPRVAWEPVDEVTAVLVVPFGEKRQKVVVRFDPESGKIQYVEVMKYRDADHKVLWINAVWFDQGKPWIRMEVDEIVYNVDVSEEIRSAPSQESFIIPT